MSIVIISGDQALRTAVTEAAGAEHLPVVDRDAVASADEGGRVVVVADIDDDAGALERLRSAIAPSAWTRLGIVAVTRAPTAASQARLPV